MSLSSTNEQASFFERPAELLQRLCRFNITNPLGNERECVEWINEMLRDGGYETKILAKDTERPNLLARLEGRDEVPSLLLHGHVDVVPVEGRTGSIRRLRERTWTAESGAGGLAPRPPRSSLPDGAAE
jgi:acetylornithine deacetylase/succinyl-diaminopimelate desuccinylase-like protein